MVIKGVLREELQNSRRMKKRYEQELASLPRGSLVRRKIKGGVYYYLVYREKGKFRADYMGPDVPEKKRAEYREAKELRAKYRNALSRLKKQIRYLEGALRGKEDV
jgi:hypothetical protein